MIWFNPDGRCVVVACGSLREMSTEAKRLNRRWTKRRLRLRLERGEMVAGIRYAKGTKKGHG